ncbi:MAG: oligosaccharide flippase family protein [Lacibacter sp.]
MGQIRKQAIISSIVIYIGFLIGFVNTWFFIRSGNHAFTPDEYGLTRLFFDVGQLMFGFAALGAVPVVYKFFPYYRSHLAKKQIDLYGWTLLLVLIGFLLVVAGGIIFEPLIVRKYSGRSALFVNYYHWNFLFGFGILLFSLFEAYSWTYQKTIATSFLRETGLRLLTLVLILLFISKLISFDSFIKLFSFQFLILALALFIYLKLKTDLHFTFRQSVVTAKFKKKMTALAGYVYGGSIIVILSQVADTIIISSVSKEGLHDAGIYNLSTYIANLIQVPQRSIVAITIPALSLAWKNKNMHEISRIYSRTSINLLLAGLFIFLGIWLNINDAFQVLNIQGDYKTGIAVIFILGITKIIDAGTGVNGQIIGTSTQWKFDFTTGVILILLILPLNYFLVIKFGIIGSAYANLISFTIYNFIRWVFLWKRYNLQPFNSKTLLSIILAAAAYFICYYLLKNMSGWTGIILRSAVFTVLFVAGVFAMKLTPDAMQLVHVLKNRFKKS